MKNSVTRKFFETLFRMARNNTKLNELGGENIGIELNKNNFEKFIITYDERWLIKSFIDGELIETKSFDITIPEVVDFLKDFSENEIETQTNICIEKQLTEFEFYA